MRYSRRGSTGPRVAADFGALGALLMGTRSADGRWRVNSGSRRWVANLRDKRSARDGRAICRDRLNRGIRVRQPRSSFGSLLLPRAQAHPISGSVVEWRLALLREINCHFVCKWVRAARSIGGFLRAPRFLDYA